MKKVLIRADSSYQTGQGHLTRCLALACMLKDSFDITFFCKEILPANSADVKSNSFKLTHLASETDFLGHANAADIVVLDGYGFNKEYQKKIKQKGCKLVCIDDLCVDAFAADLIINHAPGVTRGDYSAEPYTQFALGPDYALLRPAFLSEAKVSRKITRIETLFISFGGSDPKNLTEFVLRMATTFKSLKKINVVTGSAFSNPARLTEIINSDSRTAHYSSVDEKTMLEIMKESDLAVIPSSGTLFEALAAGCIIVSGYYVTNQKAIYSGFNAMNAIYGVDDFQNLNGILNSLINSDNVKQKTKILDGKSGMRLLEKFKLL